MIFPPAILFLCFVVAVVYTATGGLSQLPNNVDLTKRYYKENGICYVDVTYTAQGKEHITTVRLLCEDVPHTDKDV